MGVGAGYSVEVKNPVHKKGTVKVKAHFGLIHGTTINFGRIEVSGQGTIDVVRVEHPYWGFSDVEGFPCEVIQVDFEMKVDPTMGRERDILQVISALEDFGLEPDQETLDSSITDEEEQARNYLEALVASIDDSVDAGELLATLFGGADSLSSYILGNISGKEVVGAGWTVSRNAAGAINFEDCNLEWSGENWYSVDSNINMYVESAALGEAADECHDLADGTYEDEDGNFDEDSSHWAYQDWLENLRNRF